MSGTVETGIEIRPFHVDIPDEALDDLRRRIAATQSPEKETVEDQSQGVPLAMMQKLAGYWATDYDWRQCEATLNALPQFVIEIDGLDIHFIHVLGGSFAFCFAHEERTTVEPSESRSKLPCRSMRNEQIRRLGGVRRERLVGIVAQADLAAVSAAYGLAETVRKVSGLPLPRQRASGGAALRLLATSSP